MQASRIFALNEKEFSKGERLIINQGGTSSTKTFSILQLLYFIAFNSDKPLVISVVGQSLPHLKLGALRDWQLILQSFGVIPDEIWQKTDNIFTINKSIVEFFSTDNIGKVHGPRRDILFINECNNISYEVYTQLEIRTRQTIFLDFNPVSSFWIEDEIFSKPNTFKLIRSTYRDNPFLDASIVKSIESRKHNANWWKIYGLGEFGVYDGLIIQNWKFGEFFDTGLSGFGLDFGFNDPDAMVKVSIDKGQRKIYVRQELYKSGNSTADLIGIIKAKNLGVSLIVADSAESRLIEDIRRQGVNIIRADKSAGSISEGIKTIQGYELIVDENSTDLVKELKNYIWNDKKAGIPIDDFNHLLDAMRYIVMRLLTRPNIGISI